jgi:isopenicillin-N N-acyltransferase-like protein
MDRYDYLMFVKRSCLARLCLFLIGFPLISSSVDAGACTLFGAIGSCVEGGGVLVGKTRDRPENLQQVFIEVSPKAGYRYRGISTKGKSVVTSGTNEKGLVVVSAAASHFKKEGPITTVGKILSRVCSVDGVVAMCKKGEVEGPISYLVGDRNVIAIVEVIDGRQNAFLIREEGVLSHTNHFILKEMKAFNPKVGASSQARVNRIQRLLEQGPFTTGMFIGFTKDHSNGPGSNSICRHDKEGTRPGERTLSAAVFYVPREGVPEMWVALGQPCETTFEKR